MIMMDMKARTFLFTTKANVRGKKAFDMQSIKVGIDFLKSK